MTQTSKNAPVKPDETNADDTGLIRHVLKKNRLAGSPEVKRFSSGVANKAYGIDDDYVLKIEGRWKGLLAHYKKITGKLIAAKAKVPKILDSGEFEGTPYLLMEKVRGTNLVYDWLKLDIQEKENFIAQIAEELQKFHSISFDDYAIRTISGKIQTDTHAGNFKDLIARVIDFKTIAREKLEPDLREEISLLEFFYPARLPLVDETGTAVLTHTDLHFENVFREGIKLTGIIDFDWVCQAPRDYELWKIIEVFRMPHFAVEKRLEPVYENYRMTEEFGFLKKHYPALFEHPKLAERVKLYYVKKIIERVTRHVNEKRDEKSLQMIRQEIADIYRNGWLERLLA